MSKISCNVHPCVHNANGGCSLSRLSVNGRTALTSAGTNCDSFTEADGPRNEVGCRCNDADISCKAERCKYNCNGHCSASQVGITGPNACGEYDTCCETFIKEK